MSCQHPGQICHVSVYISVVVHICHRYRGRQRSFCLDIYMHIKCLTSNLNLAGSAALQVNGHCTICLLSFDARVNGLIQDSMAKAFARYH